MSSSLEKPQFKGETMTDVTFDDSAWKCALKCAVRRSNDLCSTIFYTSYCDNCTFFVKNYLPAEVDDQAVKLLMLKADEEAWSNIMKDHLKHIGAAAFIVSMLFFWIVWDHDPFWARIKAKTTAPHDIRGFIVDTGTEQHANIDETLSKVAEELWRGRDVNWDRQLNCIDATVVFYHYFPDKSKVCIMSNVNPAKNFNHLFISVFTDGVWKAIEPQAYYSGNESYWMEDVWDSRYDMRYDREETRLWRWYLPWKIGNFDFTSLTYPESGKSTP
jgi:hypothetical protein